MNTLNLSLLFWPYLLLIAICCLFFFFNIFHIYRYAISSPGSYWVAFAYFFSFAVMLIGTILLTINIDWQTPLNLNLPSLTSSKISPF